MKKPVNLPLISIVIPAYNGEKTLINTLSGVLDQTYTHFEIIIVDDGSENPVEPFLRSSIKDNRIRIFRTERSNANVARNYGIQKSKGEYIAMLDADDYWLENHLEDCLELLQRSNTDGLYGSVYRSSGNFNKISEDNIQYARELKKRESIVDYLLMIGCGAQISTLFTTAHSMRKTLWNPSLIDHQDYDFVTRFYRKFKMDVKKDPTVIYSISSGREPHFETCIEFVEKNRSDIALSVYTEYNKNMYAYAVRKQASLKIIAYFQREATRYKENLSYRQYWLIKKPRTGFQSAWNKLTYLFYIICTNLQVYKKQI